MRLTPRAPVLTPEGKGNVVDVHLADDPREVIVRVGFRTETAELREYSSHWYAALDLKPVDGPRT